LLGARNKSQDNPQCRSRWTRGLRRSLRPVDCWDWGFEARQGHGCLSLVSFVFCQVEVSAKGRSAIQKIHTECGVPECDQLQH
jgi:hypothetical protein